MAKQPFEDDGRTIADMSGIERPNLLGGRLLRKKREASAGAETAPAEADRPWEQNTLSKKEGRSYIFGAILAGLLIVGVFILAGALLIAGMIALWR